jgi:hypothetical protein
MFIHFSPTSFLDEPDHLHPDHAPPWQGKDDILGSADDLDPALFNPSQLNCRQWARAAKSAGMRFAVLTSKHHDGFCLWPSKYSRYSVANGFRRDVIREYVNAFRSEGLQVGLYYSIRDRTDRIAGVAEHGGVDQAKIDLIKAQLTELLTGYGEIFLINFDGWGNVWHESPSFYDISYNEIYDLVKSLQPNCIIANHCRIRRVSDVPQIELRAGMNLLTNANWPSIGGDTLQDRWFWYSHYPKSPLKSVSWVIEENLKPLNNRNGVFILNCAPNRDGLMDDNVVLRLAEIGAAWTPPEPLTAVPDSWHNWPTPVPIRTNVGSAIALNPSMITASCVERADAIIFTDPLRQALFTVSGSWLRIDLGRNVPLLGVKIWNIHHAMNEIFELGNLLWGPDGATDEDNLKLVSIDEAPGYPTYYSIPGPCRYIIIRSLNPGPVELGLIEVITFTSMVTTS